MKKFTSSLILVIFCLVASCAQAQSAYGPMIGFTFNSLADRTYIEKNSIKSPEPEIHFGGIVTHELSPYLSLLGTADYSFQNFSVYADVNKREMRLQYLNFNPGLQLSSFDEGQGVFRPYLSILSGLSVMTSKRVVDANPSVAYPTPTSFRIRMGLGAGVFFKFSEFTRLNISADFNRTFTEAFIGSDSRMNSVSIRAGLLFMK